MPLEYTRPPRYTREFSKKNSKLNETRYFRVSFKP